MKRVTVNGVNSNTSNPDVGYRLLFPGEIVDLRKMGWYNKKNEMPDYGDYHICKFSETRRRKK